MINQVAERTIARILGIGSACVAVYVMGLVPVTDPVNVTKLFALGGVAAGSFAVLLAFGARELWASSKSLVVVAGLLVATGISAVVNSNGPLAQNLYGVYGRNTAFITYILLIFVLLAAAILRARASFTLLIWGLLGAGFVNVAYCLWAINFGDFIPWNNPYGNILGTFGNPNFIGAFLGLFAASLVAYGVQKGIDIKIRLSFVVIFLVAVYEIINSNAIQGRVVVAAGLGIVGFYLVRSKFENVLAQIGYVAVIATGGVFALLGALQIGPFTKFIYKSSVSLRGEYWQAGWNMGTSHPFTGVGFDTYGDWYRRARDTQALVLPGPNTVTNAAHNVPFDVFAFGGWPLFVSYLAVLVLSVIAIIKVTIRTRAYDGVFVTLTTAWLCYQLQSIISINQIGLAVWGWLFGGALIAYEIATRPAKIQEEGAKSAPGKGRRVAVKKQSEAIFSSTMVAVVGAVVGSLIAVPPYSADAKWRSAISSQDAQKIAEALVPGYLNPPSSYKYATAVQLLENSKLYDLAYKYAQIGVQFNPDNFDSWKMFYFISKSSAAEKAIALENMKRLDPNNPNVLG
jgi:O-antigen ligase